MLAFPAVLIFTLPKTIVDTQKIKLIFDMPK